MGRKILPIHLSSSMDGSVRIMQPIHSREELVFYRRDGDSWQWSHHDPRRGCGDDATIGGMMISSAWAAEAARQIAEQPIFMTWNFFLTLILVPAVGWFITRSIKTSDELKEKLFRNSIENLEKAINDWQIGAKERSGELCKKIDAITKKLEDKVDVPHCNERHHEVRAELKDLKEKLYT